MFPSGLILAALSQFEVDNSFVIVPDPVNEVAAFFTCFNQLEVNDLDPVDLWGFGPPYVDFHGFKVLEDCAFYLEVIYSNRGDFMQGFRLCRSARKYFLKLFGSVINNIEHNFIDTIFIKRSLLAWALLWSSFFTIFVRLLKLSS